MTVVFLGSGFLVTLTGATEFFLEFRVVLGGGVTAVGPVFVGGDFVFVIGLAGAAFFAICLLLGVLTATGFAARLDLEGFSAAEAAVLVSGFFVFEAFKGNSWVAWKGPLPSMSTHQVAVGTQ